MENPPSDSGKYSAPCLMLKSRKATPEDCEIYFRWANEKLVRSLSYNSEPISFSDHNSWFKKAIASETNQMLVFLDEKKDPVGQVRITIISKTRAQIGISVDSAHRGKGYATEMLKIASGIFLDKWPEIMIEAWIKKENTPSYNAFIRAGYLLEQERKKLGAESWCLICGKEKNEPN